MLETLLGSKNAERVLFFIAARKEAYAREIALYYSTSLSPIQKQLDKFEIGGLLVSRRAGKTRLYFFNPRYPFSKEMNELLEKAILFLSETERERLTMIRKRPRRKGKPL